MYSIYTLDYIIWKLISYPKKTSRLCNPEANQAHEKRLMNYIIQKLISYTKKTFRLYNSEANHAYKKKAFGLHNP